MSRNEVTKQRLHKLKIPKSRRDRQFLQKLLIIKNRDSSIFYPSKKVSCPENIGTIPSLAKVEKNVFFGKYTHNPWRFIKDVNVALEFIKSKFTKKAKTFKSAAGLQDVFSSQMDQIMEEYGYCCGTWHIQQARSITCSGNAKCYVEDNTFYYRHQELTYCQNCFDNLPNEIVKINDDLALHKDYFDKYLYHESKVEFFVRCIDCKRKFHEACVLFTKLSGNFFCCPNCDYFNVKKIHPRAEMLPTTDCDNYVSQFLKTQGLNPHNNIIIRLLSEMDKQLRVKNIFRHYRNGASEYNYRNCTLFTFFDTGHHTDICFFSVFYQLYGNDCPEPNQNTAYVSYIDSVNLLPSIDRTKIYRGILLGLFAYLKTKGYEKIYLWSCPPKQDQDYIFCMKPPKMKMPTRERLNAWYLELLELGVKLNVFDSYSGIEVHAQKEGWNDIESIPYLEGDLWLTRMEEAIVAVNRDLQKLKDSVIKLKLYLKKAKTLGSSSTAKVQESEEKLKKKIKELEDFNFMTKIWRLVNAQIHGFNEEYFVIRLTASSRATPSREMQKDVEINRYWLNDRSTFVDFFCGFMLQFSDERYAQFSTYLMLYRIFLESKFCLKCRKEAPGGVSGLILCKLCHNKLVERKHLASNDKAIFAKHNWLPFIRLERIDAILSANSEAGVANDSIADTDSISSVYVNHSDCEEQPEISKKCKVRSKEGSFTPDSGIQDCFGMFSQTNSEEVIYIDSSDDTDFESNQQNRKASSFKGSLRMLL